MSKLIQKLINYIGFNDYYFIVPKGSEYNTTNKTELHNIDSIDPILTGDFIIIKAIIRDWFLSRFYY